MNDLSNTPTRGGKRSGAGRKKGSMNKSTIAKAAISEVLDISDDLTLEAAIHKRGHTLLIEMERIATDPTQPVGARIMAAKVALPFLVPRREEFRSDTGAAPNLIALMQQRRNQLAEMRGVDRDVKT